MNLWRPGAEGGRTQNVVEFLACAFDTHVSFGVSNRSEVSARSSAGSACRCGLRLFNYAWAMVSNIGPPLLPVRLMPANLQFCFFWFPHSDNCHNASCKDGVWFRRCCVWGVSASYGWPPLNAPEYIRSVVAITSLTTQIQKCE